MANNIMIPVIKNKPANILLILLLLLFTLSIVKLSGSVAVLPGMQLGHSEVNYLVNDKEFPRRITDPIGRHIDIVKPPQSIVSNILAGDEMLGQLVELERIRSVTYLADDPGISNSADFYKQHKHLPRKRGGVEETLATEPDLVIVASYSDATAVEMLLNAGVPIIRFAKSDNYQDISNNVRTLARAVGAEERAEQWLKATDKRIDAVQQKVNGQDKPRVLFYTLSGSSSGVGTLMDETIRLAGGRNAIADTGLTGHIKISAETAIALQADVILVSDWAPGKNKTAKEILMADPAWQDVPAVKSNRIYSLRGAWLTSVTPFRVQGIEVVAKLLHPSVFDTVEMASSNHQKLILEPYKTYSLNKND